MSMASAQVQRKQDHLEAGRKRLEEFRKKKAADRAKKASTTTANNVTSDPEIKSFKVAKSNVVLPNVLGETSLAGNGVNLLNKDFSNHGSASDTYEQVNDQEVNKPGDFSVLRRVASVAEMPTTSQSGVFLHEDVYSQPYSRKISDKSSAISSLNGLDRFQATQSQQVDDSTSKVINFDHEGNVQSPWHNTSVSGSEYENANDVEQNKQSSNLSFSSYEQKNFGDSFYGHQKDYNAEEKNFSTSTKSSLSWDTLNEKMSLYNYTPETQVRRSRPSFLDSLNLGTPTQLMDSKKETNTPSESMAEKTTLIFQNYVPENDARESFSTLKSKIASNFSGNSIKLEAHYDGESNITDKIEMETKQNEFLASRDDGFAALEQHIEDLTQEKFSLQRALDASQAFAESLAAENSSMTDSYNQQRSMVNQLKADMENLQEEIKERLLDLEAVKIEYYNAQLECNAADERAKLLASEVIGLEEKALKIRSNELKLERRMEDLQSEINSQKKKICALEKERNDMKNAIDVLHEEKKFLQTKLRKHSASSKSIDFHDASSKKDVSTDTEGIDASTGNWMNGDNVPPSDSSTSMVLDNIPLSSEYPHSSIPPDQMNIVQSINALISELALERVELLRALISQSSECSTLKIMNKELSRKLEAQTQRLELLTTQKMTSGSVAMGQSESPVYEEDSTFADEGDEVVERVLQWIMKLFPGGPSKRRTSKLL